MELLSMNYIWGNYKDKIRRGVSLCDHLNVDFVGVKFFRNSNFGRFKRQYIVIRNLQDSAAQRGGLIYFTLHGTLAGLLDGNRGKPGSMSYSKFMNEYVWTNNFYCSRALLDV